MSSVPRSFALAVGAPPRFQPNTVPAVSWWQQYVYGLLGNYGWSPRISQVGLTELDAGTDAVLNKVPLINAAAGWQQCTPPYVYTSVVAGSVQSGKTRSMIGLAAKAFDRGFRIVVVLSGLKNDLREQTAKRFHADLLQCGEAIYDPQNNVVAHTHPSGLGIQGSRGDFFALPFDRDAQFVSSLLLDVQRHLQLGHSVLLVVKKHQSALSRVRAVMSCVWAPTFSPHVPLFVIDDECDEASVPGRPTAPTPQSIRAIWQSRPHNVPVAYVGYTATLQANIFQHGQNPLYPQEATVLRSASHSSNAVSYLASGHPDGWYTGSDVFYEWLRGQHLPNHFVRDQINLPQEIDADPHWNWRGSELEQALMAYFVSGAIRLIVSQAKVNQFPFAAPPHAMLVHTHGGVTEHEKLALAVCGLCNGHRVSSSWYQAQGARGRINSTHMSHWLTTQNRHWLAWYDEFYQCFNDLQTLYANQFRPWVFPTWNAVQAELHSHVFPNTQLKIVNSDASSEEVDFTKYFIHGQPQPARDELTIVIGGNKLSRGITIDGLTISYFTRRPQDPVDDTTVQRQRWFGYRGKHIEFCRLFTTPVVHEELRRAGHADVEALHHLANITAQGITDFKSYYNRAHGAGRRSTSRPGAGSQPNLAYTEKAMSLTYVHCASTPSNRACPIAIHNQQAACRLATNTWQAGTLLRRGGGGAVGYMQAGMSAAAVADLLDDIWYEDHNPAVDDPLCQRFAALESVYSLPAQSLHRAPHALSTRRGRAIPAERDPYLIAAYLRSWHAMYVAIQQNRVMNRASAMYGNALAEWIPVNAPKFNVVFRFGSAKPMKGSPFQVLGCDLPQRGFVSKNEVNALWAGAPQSRDEWIDQHPHPPVGASTSRTQGMDGLLVLYVIDPTLHPSDKTCEYPTFAISIPGGGPFLRATVCR